MTTKIEWAEETWSPITGCTKISEGCKNCYAERMAKRLANIEGSGYDKDDPFKVTYHPERLDQPLKWKKPRRIFVCSMGDLFHEDVPFWKVDEVFAIMQKADHHIYMVLTKRPRRMHKYFTEWLEGENRFINLEGAYRDMKIDPPRVTCFPFHNVWLGVTVENQAAADERIPWLLKTPAEVRFVSVEPMLGPVNLEPYLQYPPMTENYKMTFGLNEFKGLDWVICGGESGPHARPMHPDWARGLRDQCQVAGVPFFFKQWGEWGIDPQEGIHWQYSLNNLENGIDYSEHYGKLEWWTCASSTEKKKRGNRTPVAYDQEGNATVLKRVGKKAAGRLLDWREWNEWPEVE